MKKFLTIMAVVLIVILLAGGGYVFLRSSLPNTEAVSVKKITPTPILTPTPVSSDNNVFLAIDPIKTPITAKITVSGKTVPNAEVTINDLDIKADKLGSFSGTLTLDEGDNYILIMAADENGNSREQELKVTYLP